MSPSRITLALVIAFGTFSVALAEPNNWPQWRGPNRTDISPETGLRTSWPENGPPQLWLFDDCGIGYSGPAIVDGMLYTMGSRNETEQIIAVKVADGTEVWAANMGEELENGWGNGPRGTPAVVDGMVYALGANGDLVCVKASDGELVWKVNLVADFGGSVPNWGYSESVLVENGQVFCTPGGDQGTMIALNAKTGEKVWQSAQITDNAHYASIVPTDLNGKRQLIQLVESTLFSVDAASGEVLWKSDWPGRTAVIPTPIVKDNFVYVTSGYGVGCKLVEIDANNQPKEVYDNKVMKNHHGGVILIGDHIYGYSDGLGWVCQEMATGEQVWNEKDRLGKGAIGYADGMLYCCSEDEGTVVLIEASTEGWKEHGRFTMSPQTELRKPRGRIWVHPVIIDGKLFLRDQDLLHCYDVRH